MTADGERKAHNFPSFLYTSLVILFIAFGAFLRIYNFTKIALWIDEYATWWTIIADSWLQVAERVFFRQGQSPAYFLIVRASTNLFGLNTFGLRLPSIVFGIATLALVYPLGLQVFRDRYPAVLALAAFTVNGRMIYYSQEARPYSIDIFFLMLSLLFFLRLLKENTLRNRICYVLSTVFAYYFHYLSIAILVVQIIYLIWIRGIRILRSREWRKTFLLLALLCLPGVYQLLHLYISREQFNWIPGQPGTGLQSEVLDSLHLNVMATLIFSLLLLNLNPRTFANEDKPSRLLIALWFLLPIVLFAIVPRFFGIILFHRRYFLASLPAIPFLFALVMAVSTKGIRQWIPLCIYMTLSFLLVLKPIWRAEGTFVHHKSDRWDLASARLKESIQTGDLVLYRTSFPEADSWIVRQDARTLSYIRWPLDANLGSDFKAEMLTLPFRETSRTSTYLSRTLNEATTHQRVWLIGTGTSRYTEKLLATGKFHQKQTESYGNVDLKLFQR